jgi:hypothetical protein
MRSCQVSHPTPHLEDHTLSALRRYLFSRATFTAGRGIAEAVSRWLPTAATEVRTRVWQVGFVVDKVASEQVFCEYFDFH